MRAIRHLTPRYVYHRLVWHFYQRRNPTLPWLTPEANDFLSRHLTKSHVGWEWGSGRSTAWFASKLQHITSVEHYTPWYNKVADMLRGVDNVDYCYRPIVDVDHPAAVEIEGYAGLIAQVPDESLDFVLVDGALRDHCALAAIDKVRPGGWLVVDNANWYLPNNSSAPASVRVPASALWGTFLERTKDWPRRWTTQGITCTAIFTKP